MIMKKIIYSAITLACYCLLLLGTTACEGADLYEVNAPGWLQDKSGEEVKTDVVVTNPTPAKLGAEDNTQAWWSVFTDDIKAEPGKTYQVKFINYGGASNWNNFVVILRKGDKSLGAEGEYAILRADNWGWGYGWTGEELAQHCTPKMEEGRDWGTWLAAMNLAKCTVEITNKDNGRADVKCTMLGSDGVTYTQDYTDIVGIDKDDLYFSFTVDHSHIEFGDIDVKDTDPISMVLHNVPAEINVGDDLNELMAGVTADVTFKGVPSPKTIKAEDLQFRVLPDMETPGEKTLVVVYNKTFLGKTATVPAVTMAKVQMVMNVKSISITKQPATTDYENVFSNGYPFNPNGMEVTATFSNGATAVLNNSQLKFSSVPGTVGTHNITVSTENGKTATVQVNVKSVLQTNAIHPSPTKLGAEDNSQAWWTVFTDDVKLESGKSYQVNFQNYGGSSNWNNFVIILRKADKTLGGAGEYAVLRSDNWGWGNGWTGEQLAQHCTPSGPQADWGTWLKAMSNAKVYACFTNKGDGTIDVRTVMVGNDGVVYKQDYLNLQNNINANDVNLSFTVDGCHLVFE